MTDTGTNAIKELEDRIEALEHEKKALQKVISHDIRSPFNKVHALIQLMKMDEDTLTKDQKEYLESMHITIMSGLELIRNLHDARLIDEGRIDISKEQADLFMITSKAISNFEDLAELKNIKIEFVNQCKKAEVLTDAHYLQRAIENVISNAIKYSYDNKPIVVTLSKEDNIYSIKVDDFGQGVRLEEVKLLFRKFQRLAAKATKGESSAGLGLYLADHFVRNLGGEIFHKNEKKGMTSFVIQLPA